MDDFTKALVASALRHAMTAAAGILVGYGLLETGQTDNFVAIGSGFVVGAIGLGWSYFQKRKTIG